MFEGVIWNILQVPGSTLLILEIRDEERREARFSALDFEQNTFVFKNILFEEPWWIGMTAATREVLLLHVFQHTENPDRKDLMAWDIYKQERRWKLDDFSFDFLSGNKVHGRLLGKDDAMTIDLSTGRNSENNSIEIHPEENIHSLKPFQYVAGTDYFDMVNSFLTQKLNVASLAGVEYLEYDSLIFISYHAHQESLVNQLVVLTPDGTIILHEKLGGELKGIGLETFFILSGCLFFVRNKVELVSYRIV